MKNLVAKVCTYSLLSTETDMPYFKFLNQRAHIFLSLLITHCWIAFQRVCTNYQQRRNFVIYLFHHPPKGATKYLLLCANIIHCYITLPCFISMIKCIFMRWLGICIYSVKNCLCILKSIFSTGIFCLSLFSKWILKILNTELF